MHKIRYRFLAIYEQKRNKDKQLNYDVLRLVRMGKIVYRGNYDRVDKVMFENLTINKQS
jgi:hypothetical protein